MSQRILIAGYIGFDNAGDEAIAQVVIGHLRERVADAEITVISGDPPRTAERYGVRAIWWRDPLAIADAVRTTDLTILGGGGLFQDYWGFDPTTILTREHWGLSFYVAPALLSAVYGKPLMLYAVGAGPLLSDHGRTYTKVAGDIAARITVRDQISKNLFESLGVAPGKIAITADPAFDLTPEPAPALPEVLEWKSAGPAIAVCLRTWNFGADSTFSDRELARALDDVLVNEGGRVLFVPFAGGDDIYVARRVHKQMKQRERAAVLEQPCSPNALAGIVGSADLVLGMRLHSVIFSIAAQTPVVALEYDPKLAGLAALTGLEDFTLPFGGVEWDVLSRRLRQALHEKDRFRALTGPLTATLRERARENADLAVELLRRGSQTVDYGPDARTLVGRLVMAQVTGSENLIGRLARCAEAMNHPVGEMRPLEMADSVVKKVEEAQARIRELEGLHTQWTDCRQEEDRLQRELQDARREAEAQRERFESELRQSADAAAELERRLAPHESKTFGGIVKRTLQAALDMGQLLTPGPLRNAVRKYYLNWFYFRVYPERRP